MADVYPSRYQSHRRNQRSVDETPATPPSAEHDSLARSKSRYHRKQPGSPEEAVPTSAPRPSSNQQEQHSSVPSRYHSKHRQSPLNTLYREQVIEAPGRPSGRRSDNERSDPTAAPAARDHRVLIDVNQRNDQHSASSEGDSSVQQALRSTSQQTSALQTAFPSSQPTGELFPPPRPIDPPTKRDGPPQSGNIRATKSMSELPRYDSDGEAGCFAGLFRRKKAEADNATTPRSPRVSAKAGVPAVKQAMLPAVDAPLSAINAADRRVLIECAKTKTLFPVTPITTPFDLIKSAATCMPESINVKSAVLLEQFNTVGVQRPLRRYEHIRDVMNSWDNDKQNSLLLIDPNTGNLERELTMIGVPQTEPEAQSWTFMYSQKVGKWDKRFITLRQSGQLTCQKDPEKSKDVVNVCHLSDFDIYTPTAEKSKKKIRPPKKYCFAVKSQQKSSLFETTENFVHFFSTGDRDTADSFYNAVQSWRSWYLVHVMGEGKKEKEKASSVPFNKPETNDMASNVDRSRTHRVKESTDSHYQLGSFKPLIDMDQFEGRRTSGQNDRDNREASGGFAKSANQFDINVSPERRTSTSRRQHPPMSLSKRPQLAEDEPLANLNRQSSVKRSSADQRRPDTSDFRDTSLLGRSYSHRRKEQAERESQNRDPFTPGPNLLNRNNTQSAGNLNDGLQRRSSTRKQTNSSGDLKRSSSTRAGADRVNSADLERSGTRRQRPKPLVDLTPTYKEPPQHSKKGRGYKPDQIKEGGLISDATSPEDPLGIPVTTIFRNTSRGNRNGPSSQGLVDSTPQNQEVVYHARKGRGHRGENDSAGGLIGSPPSSDDSLGLPQNKGSRNVNTLSDGRRRTGSVSESAQPSQTSSSMPKGQDGFTGEGLLASHRQGWGTATKGRGVIDGSRAGGKPLVDLSETSQFVGGSLLSKVERAVPIPAPIIDREKRRERVEKYGEGY